MATRGARETSLTWLSRECVCRRISVRNLLEAKQPQCAPSELSATSARETQNARGIACAPLCSRSYYAGPAPEEEPSAGAVGSPVRSESLSVQSL